MTYSDSRADPSPTIAQLLTLTPDALLALSVPEYMRGQVLERRDKVMTAALPKMEKVGRPKTHHCVMCGTRFLSPYLVYTCSKPCQEKLRHEQNVNKPSVLMYWYLCELAEADGMGWRRPKEIEAAEAMDWS